MRWKLASAKKSEHEPRFKQSILPIATPKQKQSIAKSAFFCVYKMYLAKGCELAMTLGKMAEHPRYIAILKHWPPFVLTGSWKSSKTPRFSVKHLHTQRLFVVLHSLHPRGKCIAPFYSTAENGKTSEKNGREIRYAYLSLKYERLQKYALEKYKICLCIGNLFMSIQSTSAAMVRGVGPF